MLKKYVFLCLFSLFAPALFAQLSCPDFKIRGNKSPRSHPFTTAIKFQLDGIVQYQGISPRYAQRLGVYPALSMGLEQALRRRLSISANHGWTFNPRSENSRFLAGDVRYYFDQCFQNKWFSARITWTDASQRVDGTGMQSLVSLHYGKTARNRRIFTHYEMGIGFGRRDVIVVSLGIAKGLKL